MYFPFNIDTNTLIVYSMALTLFTLIVVFFVFVRIWKVLKIEGKLAAEERKLRHEINRDVEQIAAAHIKTLAGDSTARLEGEVKKFSEELARLMHAKSAEVSAFVEKAQREQMKESQFFVANMLSKIEKDAQEYKKNKLAAVDEQIRQVVLSAAREVIGRSISLTEHEDLVTKALERAKKEKVFG